MPRHGIDFTPIVDGNDATPITARKHEPPFLESLGEGGSRIRTVPAFLKQRLELLRIEADAARLLPFFTRVVQRIAFAPVAQPFLGMSQPWDRNSPRETSRRRVL